MFCFHSLIYLQTQPHDSNDVIHHVIYQDCCHTKRRFNHSCAPNAEYGVEEQGCMKVRMLRPVEQGEKAGADSQTRHDSAWIYVAAWIHHHLCVHSHTCIFFAHLLCKGIPFDMYAPTSHSESRITRLTRIFPILLPNHPQRCASLTWVTPSCPAELGWQRGKNW